MSRLIDADTLQKEYMTYNDGKRLMLIDVAPTIDAVEVVRCKDCKHRKETVTGVATCQGHGIAFITQANDYCSYGERKEDND